MESEVSRLRNNPDGLSAEDLRVLEAVREENSLSDEVLELAQYVSEATRKQLGDFDVNRAKLLIRARSGQRFEPLPLAHFDPSEAVARTGGGVALASLFQEGVETLHFKLHLPPAQQFAEQQAQAHPAQTGVSAEQSAMLALFEKQAQAISQLSERIERMSQQEGETLNKLALGALADQLEAGRVRMNKAAEAPPERPKTTVDVIREMRTQLAELREVAPDLLPNATNEVDNEGELLRRFGDVAERLIDAWVTTKGSSSGAGSGDNVKPAHVVNKADDAKPSKDDMAILDAARARRANG